MQPPILATGAIAWQAGHAAIQTGAFRFQHVPDDDSYAQLKRFAAQQAREHIARLKQELELTPYQWARLFNTYVHAFLNGALDEAMQQGERQTGESRGDVAE